MMREFRMLQRAAIAVALVASVGATPHRRVPAGAAAVRPDTTGTDGSDVTTKAIAAGRAVFHGQGACLACHGLQLQGSAIAPPLDKKGKPWLAAKGGTYAEILRVIEKGVPATAMLARPNGISDQAARDVAAYVWAVNHQGVKP